MQENDNKRLDIMENDIKKIMAEQLSNGHKLDDILKALHGDSLGNIGFTKRIISLETDAVSLKEARTENKIYIKIITFLMGVIAAGVIGYFVSQIMKH